MFCEKNHNFVDPNFNALLIHVYDILVFLGFVFSVNTLYYITVLLPYNLTVTATSHLIKLVCHHIRNICLHYARCACVK